MAFTQPVKVEAYGEVRQAPGTVQFIVTLPAPHSEDELEAVYNAVHNAVSSLKGMRGVATLFETKFWTEPSPGEEARSDQSETNGAASTGD